MYGTIDVKNTAIELNSTPSIKDTIGISSAQGEWTNWKADATASMAVPVINARVAPQNISPAVMSSTFSGVAIIASYVFWYSMRTKVP